MKERLPQPKDNAKLVVDVIAAIAASIPIASTFAELWKIGLQEQMKVGERILIEEIERQGIAAFADEKLTYYVPTSYQFFEKVRLGEGEYTLRKLAEIIAYGDVSGDIDVQKTNRIINAVSGLSSFELAVLSDVLKSQHMDVYGHGENINAASSRTLKMVYGAKYALFMKTESALSLLSSRGLLFSKGPVVMDYSENHYQVSSLGHDACVYASSILEESEAG